MNTISPGQHGASTSDARNPAELPNSTKLSHRNDIDGLRAIAVLAVIANHIDKTILPGGFLGVDIFFVISGYVITGSLQSRPRESFLPFLLNFYERRIRRILPALACCILLTFLAASLFIPPGSDIASSTWQTGIWALLGGSNIYLGIHSSDYFSTSTALNPFTQTWSLGVEEQFYLVYPLLFFSATRLSSNIYKPRALLLLALGATGALSLAFYIHIGHQGDWPYYFSPLRFWEIATGCMACCLGDRAQKQVISIPTIVPWICLTTCLSALALTNRTTAFSAIITVLGTAILLASNKPGNGLFELLGSRLLRPIGLGSYSLYLWHWSVLVLARWTIGISSFTLLPLLLVMGLLSYGSYKWIETPLRRSPWAGTRRGTFAFGFSSLIVSVGALAGLRAEKTSPIYIGNTCKPEKYQTCTPANSPHPPVTPYITNTSINRELCLGKTLETGLTRTVAEGCSSIRNPAGPTLIVVGDSFAGSLSPAIDKLYQQNNFNLIYLASPGCHFNIAKSSQSRKGCAEFNKQRHEFILKTVKPGDVVLFASSSGGGFLPSTFQTLAHMKAALQPRGVQLIVQQILPRFPIEIPDICYKPRQIFNQMNKQWEQCSAPYSLSLKNYLSQTANARQNLATLDDGRLLIVWNPIPELCPNQHCNTHRNGVRLYRDEGHLSIAGAQMLAPSLEAILRRTSLVTTLRKPKINHSAGNN